jgi:hypothetical protein
LFILLATQVSNTFALRFALLIVAVLQLLSVFVAKTILKGCAVTGPPTTLDGEGGTGVRRLPAVQPGIIATDV